MCFWCPGSWQDLHVAKPKVMQQSSKLNSISKQNVHLQTQTHEVAFKAREEVTKLKILN